ncbi:MAG: TonB-dependent receptor [Gemmatimonadota bacterium]
MSIRWSILVLLCLPGTARAQQDTLHQHGDSLNRRPIEVQEITVTATRARREEPLSVVSVSPRVISQTHALNTYDLLRQTTGIEVHDQGQGPGFASDASVRGFSSDHSTDLALWIDGVPINEPVNGHAEGYNDWSLLFPQSVNSIDVYKGPTSALYGNFALAGVVNVRTLERMKGSRAWVSGGAYGRLDGTLMSGFDRETAGGVFGIRSIREDGWRPNSSYELGQGHARVVKDVSPSTTLDAGAELYAAGWDSPGFLTLDQFDRRLFDTVSNSTDGGFKRHAQERLSLRTIIGTSLLWRSTVYATQGRWQLFLTTPPEGGSAEGSGSQTEEEDRRYGLGATSALTWAGENSEITVGVEGRWDHSDFENWFTTNRTRDSTQTLVSARQASGAIFVQSTTDLGHHLRLSAGGRVDVLSTRVDPDGGAIASKSKATFNPKLGLLYHVRRLADLYANVSRGFRQSDGVIEDPTAPFISAWAYETGVKFDASKVNVTLGVFRMDVSNEQSFDPITLASTSGGRSRRQGIEAEVRADLSPALTLSADWTINDARYRELVTEEGDTLTGTRVFNTARQVGIFALELAPPTSHWRVRASTNVVGPYTPFDEPGVELSSYALAHLSTGTQIGRVNLELGVRNLFDTTYAELRAGGFVVPGQPRSIYGSTQVVF